MYKITPYHACLHSNCSENTTKVALQAKVRETLKVDGIAGAAKELAYRFEINRPGEELTHFAFVTLSMIRPDTTENVVEFVTLLNRSIPPDRRGELHQVMEGAFEAIAEMSRAHQEKLLATLKDALLSDEQHPYSVDERIAQIHAEQTGRVQATHSMIEKLRGATILKLGEDTPEEEPKKNLH